MKAKITKKDGTVIELDGTATELGPFIEAPKLPQVTVGPACPGIGAKESIGGSTDSPLWRQYRFGPASNPGLYQPRIVHNDMCPMGGQHDFPTVWMNITPPACSKCGRSLGPLSCTATITAQDISGDLVENGTYTFRVPFISAFTIVPPGPQSSEYK